MSVISFKSERDNTTKVNNDFIKNEMPKMSGDYVKIYLYMLMLSSSGEDVDIENVADKFGIFTSEVIKILEVLNDKNLIYFAKNGNGFELSFENIQSVSAPLTVAKETPKMPQVKIDESLVTAYSSNVVSPKEESYSQQELAYIFESNTDITEVKEYIEQKYGVLFNATTLQQLVNIVEGDYVPCSILIDIVDYIHLNENKIIKLPNLLRAIENKAIDISEKGITNPEDIRDFLNNSDSTYKKVLKAFGLTRDIVPVEKQFVDRWTIAYHMPIEVINYAIEKTMLATHQPTFKYADSILTNWHIQNLHTLAEVKGINNVIKKPNVSTPSTSTTKFNNYSSSSALNDQELENMTQLFNKFNS